MAGRKNQSGAARRSPFDASYAPYGTFEGAPGSWREWQGAFHERFAADEIKAALTDESPFTILGVSATATAAEIKRAHRRRACETHPDQNPSLDGSEFIRVQAAYESLRSGFAK